MGKLRDKLNRVNAPRPTALPDGSTSVSADTVEETATTEPAPLPHRDEPPAVDAPARRAPSPAAPRRFDLPDRREADHTPDDDDTVAGVPRFRGALRGTGRVVEEPRLPTARRGSVFRSRDFEKWRKRRTAPELEAVRASDREPEPEPAEPLRLEREAAAPTEAVDLLRAARIALSRGRLDRAVDLLSRTLDADPDEETRRWAMRRLAELLVDRGDDAEAIPLLRALVEGRQGDPYPLVVLAELLIECEPEFAADLRRRALEIAPWLSLPNPDQRS